MRRYVLAGLVFAGISTVSAQSAYRIGPPPAWVKVHKPNLSAPPVRTEGWEYVLFDRQESVGAAIERYWDVAYRVIDQAAVADNSQIEVVVDTIYQHLTLHAVTVWRGARALPQLISSRIRVVQREKDLDDRIFDGSLTVVVVLEDVRAGDVIEYSFTRTGSNPVFRGHYMASFQLDYDVPVADQYARLLWRRARPANLRTSGTAPPATVTRTDSQQEYEWSRHNVPAVRVDTDVPDWFEPYATVQVSDFGSWGGVAAWGDSLFADATLPPALQDVVERIRAASESDERRALQALRWVQDEVRYTGVEIGVNSHQPYSPAVVIKRRYGDCKDKALLLITMLRALGIQARPALVSTTYGGRIVEYAPTAALFDHAIVALSLSGREHWIDPTDVDQRGDISEVAAYYGAALVLAPSVDSLRTMPDLRPSKPTTDIIASFELGDLDGPATMTVETKYSGPNANWMRTSLKRQSREELQQSYVEYYAKLYPSIRSNQLPVVQDDEGSNVLRVTERYTIPEFWTGDSTEEERGKFEPLELSNRIPDAAAGARTMPLSVPHPVHIRYVINAHNNKGWAVRKRHENIVTPAATFKYDARAADDVLTLSYEYETLSDHVLPAAAAEQSKGMARVSDMLVFTIRPPSAGADSPGYVNWSVLLAALLALLVACMGALRVSRSQLALAGAGAPPGGSTTATGGGDVSGKLFPPADDLVGLEGWLILVGFGICVAPLRILYTLITNLHSYAPATWSHLTTPGYSSYNALWAPALLIELVGNLTVLVFSILLIFLFFRKKKQFPVVVIWVAIFGIVIRLVDAVFLDLLAVPSSSGKWGGLVTAVIWMVYMLRSRRVRNTFVN